MYTVTISIPEFAKKKTISVPESIIWCYINHLENATRVMCPSGHWRFLSFEHDFFFYSTNELIYVDQIRPGQGCQNAPGPCPRRKEKRDAGYSDRIQTHLISFGRSPPKSTHYKETHNVRNEYKLY
jgi:hypothetical protein